MIDTIFSINLFYGFNMSSLQSFLFIFQIVLSVSIILLVLLQQTDNDSLSGISASNGNAQMMSKRTTTTPISKLTMVLFVLFMFNSLLLATFSARGFNNNNSSNIEQLVKDKENIKK